MPTSRDRQDVITIPRVSQTPFACQSFAARSGLWVEATGEMGSA